MRPWTAKSNRRSYGGRNKYGGIRQISGELEMAVWSFYAPMERVVSKIESMLANEKAVGNIAEAGALKRFPASLEFAFSKLDDRGWWWVNNMTGKSLRFADGNPKTLERSISDYLDWYASGFALEAR